MSAHTLPGPCLWIKEMCGLTQVSESKLRGGGGVCQMCPILTVFPPPGIIGRRPACWVLGAGCWLQPQATPACRGHRGPPSPRQVQWGTGTCYRVVCEHPAPRHPSRVVRVTPHIHGASGRPGLSTPSTRRFSRPQSKNQSASGPPNHSQGPHNRPASSERGGPPRHMCSNE